MTLEVVPTYYNFSCKECKRYILGIPYGIAIRHSISFQKWGFHKDGCFEKFQEAIKEITQKNYKTRMVGSLKVHLSHRGSKCRECKKYFTLKKKGLTICYSSLSADKWSFHLKDCFQAFRENVLRINPNRYKFKEKTK